MTPTYDQLQRFLTGPCDVCQAEQSCYEITCPACDLRLAFDNAIRRILEAQ